MRLPNGRVLGVPGKRGEVGELRDPRVDVLAERFDLSEMRVLELGSHEGNHTVRLAAHAKEVVAVEVRPRNVVCALVRLFVHDVRNARIVLGDVRDLDGSFGRFDVVFHVGVLYHLNDPVTHLFRIAELADRLLLDTHVAGDTTRERSDVVVGESTYEARVHWEGGWRDAFSGVDQSSRWLEREALFRVLRDAGFTRTEVLSDRVERNGSRITLLATKDPP